MVPVVFQPGLFIPPKELSPVPLRTVENRNCNANNRASAVNNLGAGRVNRKRCPCQAALRNARFAVVKPFLTAGNGLYRVDHFLDENRPETCNALGLECRSCVERSASSVAHICHGLKPAAIAGMFVQIYVSPGCAHMAHAFEAAYYEACAPIRKPVLMAIGSSPASVAA